MALGTENNIRVILLGQKLAAGLSIDSAQGFPKGGPRRTVFRLNQQRSS